MTLEPKLAGWTGPSSDTEKDKQDRTVRMVTDAVKAHDAFDSCNLSVYAKGSYANNTNVRSDSDVDIVVQCHNLVYWDEHVAGKSAPASSAYTGIWTPNKLRAELVSALTAKFGSQVDASGSTAIQVHSSTSRMDADVVPAFDYHYYFEDGTYRSGTKVFKNGGGSIVNYPDQHLAKGRFKNNTTNQDFKKLVRILKRVENAMLKAGYHREVPSYFVECLVYNVPNDIIRRTTWLGAVKGAVTHIWEELQGDDEPTLEPNRWLEVNECKYLFTSRQKWTRGDGRDFAYAAWNYLDLKDA